MTHAENTADASRLLKKNRDHLIAAFFERHETIDFTDRHTALLDQYFVDGFEKSRIGPQMQFYKKPYAMIALGGYGRREQCLHSDIDILLLFDKSIPEEANSLVRETLYPLWDLGFEVGHATRTIKECLRLAAEDIDVLTALLDARFLCGMSDLYGRLREQLDQYLTGKRAGRIISGLTAGNRRRHDRFGDSSYLLEPNLKEGQGGLRDYHTLLWIARIQSKIVHPRDLEYFGCLTCGEYQRLNNALAFIWKVRNHLHYLTRRKFDQLYFEHQISLAASLGFLDTGGQMAVERFLGKLHAEMAFIKQTNLIFITEIEAGRRPVTRTGRSRKNRNDHGLTISGNLLGFAAPEQILQSPDLLLRIFDESARLKLALNWEARRIVREFSHLADRRFRVDPANIKRFERILKTPAMTFNVLHEMLETGFLERFIPPFKSIINRIQYDGYHLYPVDRHSLRTVRTMKTFLDDTGPERLLADIYRDVVRHRVTLLWAALLHDIGKGTPGRGHSERGAGIARRFLKELGYAPDPVDTVGFLIEHHLLLIKTATRRDINDEETAISCARTIQTIPRLKLLYLLTAADSMATGPKAWNDWTAALLRDLFFKTLNILEKGELATRKTVATVRKKRAAILTATVSEKEKPRLQAHLDILSPRYLIYADNADLIDHMRLYHRLKDQPFVWRIEHGRNHLTRRVTVCAVDRPGLFSRIAGVFALNNLNILEAEIYTWKNGVALDIFTVRPPADLIFEEQHWQKTADLLASAIEDRLDPAAAISATTSNRVPVTGDIVRPYRMLVDNDTSGFFTIIEVFCHDFPGLLFHITDTLFRHRLDVRVAKIGTKIDQVVDVFYVRDRDGQKLAAPDRIEALREDVEAILSSRSPPDRPKDEPELETI